MFFDDADLFAPVVPTSKTRNTSWARLGSLAKVGTTGAKRSASSKNIAAPISNK